jgi:uncharacterized OB-fold protein
MKLVLKKSWKITRLNTRKKTALQKCNLCPEQFHPRTPFDRYCPECKENNELLKFSEWFPELDESYAEKISA